MKTLRTIYLIFFFLLLNISYGQDYKFDKIVKYNFSGPFSKNKERTDLFNSKDFSYHMQIYRQNDSLLSRIRDTKKGRIHYFNINKSDSLEFIRTESIKEIVKAYTFKYSEIKKEKDKNKLTLKILNKRKIGIAKFKLNIKETDQNFLPIFNLSAFETLLITEIDPPLNFIILKAKGRNLSGIMIEYELESIEDFNTTITIP
jgi:hypothetical protein